MQPHDLITATGSSDWEAQPSVKGKATEVQEHRVTLRNTGSEPITLLRCDAYCYTIPGQDLYIQYFESRWGQEFMPCRIRARSIAFSGQEGRSSAGLQPQMLLMDASGRCLLAVTVAWSGNWRISFRTCAKGLEVRAGVAIDDPGITVARESRFVSPSVLSLCPQTGTIDEVSYLFGQWVKAFGPQSPIARQLPVEWNPWWCYEDDLINEAVFLRNVDAAAALGIEAVVLDAGWYGDTEHWFDVRGDWDHVNTDKFPSGIRALSDAVHEKGMRFGLWCEIEAVGKRAKLAKRQPAYVAERDGEPLGYLCFGNPSVQRWAYQTLDRLITVYGLDWIKLDFNAEPWQGCNCTDHGHGAADGLIAHYQGYYAVLDRLHARHPSVLLENCASGGQRFDHGILQHTHCSFLSDIDETQHKLRVLSGAFTFAPPARCLQWVWSHTKPNAQGQPPFPGFVPGDPQYSDAQRIFHLRAGMLGWMGLSHRLAELDRDTRTLFARQIAFYREVARPFIKDGIVSDLTRGTFFPVDRPLYAFQYTMAGANKALIFVFCLTPGTHGIRPNNLVSARGYRVTCLDTQQASHTTGEVLMAFGLSLGTMAAEQSLVYLIEEA